MFTLLRLLFPHRIEVHEGHYDLKSARLKRAKGSNRREKWCLSALRNLREEKRTYEHKNNLDFSHYFLTVKINGLRLGENITCL